MSGSSDQNPGINRKAILLIAIPVTLFIVIIFIWIALSQDGNSQLMPPLPEPTEIQTDMEVIQEPISFNELNADPILYLNKMIVVSGNYLPLEDESCLNFTGPDFRWSLTSENLQLDALGYERIVDLVPENTTMTVQGIWRLYQGPLGCGKGPPDGNAWYLQVKKILQPNPLVSAGGQPIPNIVGGQDLGLPALVPTLAGQAGNLTGTAPSITPEQTEVSGTIPPTAVGQSTLTLTPTPVETFPPTITVSPTPSTPVVTATGNVTATPTIGGSPQATDDDTGVTVTFTPDQPPVLATSTDVPGYPGPQETPEVTPTVDPYP